jgi:diguanylate cyclase (GGDEF)-like protein
LAKRWDRPLSLIMTDIDHFKQINDRHGHPFGDEVLRVVGILLLENSRAEDVVCRYGGEEFAILTPGVALDGAATHADRLRQMVAERTFTRGGASVTVTCSFGVGDATAGSAEPAAIQVADDALYQAKAQGRNRVVRAAAAGTPQPAQAP